MIRPHVSLKEDVALLGLEEVGLVVVVVTDHIEGRALDLGRPVEIIVPGIHIIIHQVAEVDAVNGTGAGCAECFRVGSHHVLPGLHRAVHSVGTNLRVGNHHHGVILFSRLRFQNEIGLDRIRVTRDPLVALRHPGAGGESHICRNAEIHETGLLQIALHLVRTIGRRLDILPAVRHENTLQGLSGRGFDRTEDIVAVGRSGRLRPVGGSIATGLDELGEGADIAFAARRADNLAVGVAIGDIRKQILAKHRVADDAPGVNAVVVGGVVFVAAGRSVDEAVVDAGPDVGSRGLGFRRINLAYDATGGAAVAGADALETDLAVVEAAVDVDRPADVAGDTAHVGGHFAHRGYGAVVGAIRDDEARVRHSHDAADISAAGTCCRDGCEIVATGDVGLALTDDTARTNHCDGRAALRSETVTLHRAAVDAVFEGCCTHQAGNTADKGALRIGRKRYGTLIGTACAGRAVDKFAKAASGKTAHGDIDLLHLLGRHVGGNLSFVDAAQEDIAVEADKAADEEIVGSIRTLVSNTPLIDAVNQHPVVVVGNKAEIVFVGLGDKLRRAGCVDDEIADNRTLLQPGKQARLGLPALDAVALAIERPAERRNLGQLFRLGKIDVGREHHRAVGVAPGHQVLAAVAGIDESLQVFGRADAARPREGAGKQQGKNQ